MAPPEDGRMFADVTPSHATEYAQLDPGTQDEHLESRLPHDSDKWQKEYLHQVEKEHQEDLEREKLEETRLTLEELSQSGESCELDESITQEFHPELHIMFRNGIECRFSDQVQILIIYIYIFNFPYQIATINKIFSFNS